MHVVPSVHRWVLRLPVYALSRRTVWHLSRAHSRRLLRNVHRRALLPARHSEVSTAQLQRWTVQCSRR